MCCLGTGRHNGVVVQDISLLALVIDRFYTCSVDLRTNFYKAVSFSNISTWICTHCMYML